MYGFKMTSALFKGYEVIGDILSIHMITSGWYCQHDIYISLLTLYKKSYRFIHVYNNGVIFQLY